MLFNEVYLSKNNSCYTPLIYLHELVHIIIENNDYSIFDYSDYELFPILFEFIFAYYLGSNMQSFSILFRVSQLKYYIELIEQDNDLSQIIGTSYLKSTILALGLFDVFINSNYNIKKVFLNDLKKLLSEEVNLDFLLSKYDIDFENSKSKLLKRGDILK